MQACIFLLFCLVVWCPAHWKNSGLVNLAHVALFRRCNQSDHLKIKRANFIQRQYGISRKPREGFSLPSQFAEESLGGMDSFVSEAVEEVFQQLGYSSVKPEQRQAVRGVLNRDVFFL